MAYKFRKSSAGPGPIVDLGNRGEVPLSAEDCEAIARQCERREKKLQGEMGKPLGGPSKFGPKADIPFHDAEREAGIKREQEQARQLRETAEAIRQS